MITTCVREVLTPLWRILAPVYGRGEGGGGTMLRSIQEKHIDERSEERSVETKKKRKSNIQVPHNSPVPDA